MGDGRAATVRRWARVLAAMLALAGGTMLGAGESDAAESSRDRDRPTTAGTKVTVQGSTTAHDSCEGRLVVSVTYTRTTNAGDRTITRAAIVDKDGEWSTTLSHARPQTYRIGATLVGHLTGAPTWPANSVNARRSRTKEIHLGTLNIPNCKS